MNKAFTLIELLVVVLIIGILSAIALPQYTKAVEKSRMAEALQIAAGIRTGVDVYVLANGYESVELVGNGTTNGSGLLDIDAESGLNCTHDDQDFCCSKHFCFDSYCTTSNCYVTASRRQNGNWNNEEQYWFQWIKSKETGQWTKACHVEDSSSVSTSICTSFNAL